jgi:hypothetical protein
MGKTFSELVQDSSLSATDKEFWFSLLTILDQNQVKLFDDFVDGKEENLETLNKNIKSKTEAFAAGDKEMLEEILNIEQ